MSFFEQNIINSWGTKDREWLDSLPEIISKLSLLWQLSDVTPINSMNCN